MNTITITGNLGRDPETRQAGSKTVVSVSVAVSQGKDKPSMWLDVSACEDGYTAFAANNLAAARKGDKVVVSGRLSMREWEDKNGQTRQSWGITAQDVELTRKVEQQAQRTEPARNPVRHTRAPHPAETVPYDDDEPLPF